jgi:hypothetical protein
MTGQFFESLQGSGFGPERWEIGEKAVEEFWGKIEEK